MSQHDKKVENLYRYGRYHDSSLAVVQRFNILRMNRENREFVFVEGSSDATFYKNTSISILADKSAYLYAEYDSDPNIEKGKKVVYSAFDCIRKNENLRYELDKCIFVIDRDYEYYRNNRVFSITEGHSMECYFLERDNIDIIFSYFNLTEKDANSFWGMFYDFAGKCYEFFALKGTWSYMIEETRKTRSNLTKCYEKRNDNAEIFTFKFIGESYSFNEDKLNEEIDLLRDVLQSNKNFMPYYQKLYADIKDNPNMIRGHDAYEFLKQYLLQIHGITIHNNLKELIPVIKDMGVELDIKQIVNDI